MVHDFEDILAQFRISDLREAVDSLQRHRQLREILGSPQEGQLARPHDEVHSAAGVGGLPSRIRRRGWRWSFNWRRRSPAL